MKKTVSKRIICVLLVAVMAIGMLPAVAFAASNPFVDVKSKSWYSDEVAYVYEKGLMYGVTDTNFDPNGITTRAMVVGVLHRLEGSPEVSSKGFSDVKKGRWYYKSVMWAQKNNIVAGYTDTQFGPNNPMTREEMVAVFYRYAKFKGYDVSKTANVSFSDFSKTHSYAKTAVKWAVGAGLISGFSDNTVQPRANSTRAQMATVLKSFDELLNKKDGDTDGDGLFDAIEIEIGTDINKADTDGDSLNDYIEVAILGYNALLKDTDSDGTLDPQEDFDSDGINNITELNLGTDPVLDDTDVDGLKDKAEKDTYKTDPLVYDTDKDGVSDGKEVELGTNPLVKQSSFDMNITSEDIDDTVTPSVKINLKGSQVETLRIDSVENDTFFPETMPGYMGKAYEFSVDGKFSSAEISFEFDTSKLNAESDPVICYFNEKTQELELLPTKINGNTATTTVTHFSKYILIDRTIYQNSFTWVDVWDSTKNYSSAEIIMVIDDSGSLGGDYSYNSSTGTFKGGKDPEHKRLEVARNFVDNASENTKIGIVKFDGVVDDMSGGLVECTSAGKTALKNILKFQYISSGEYNRHGIFDSRGTTYMYTGIDEAIDRLSNTSDEILKAIIVFTDGEAHDSEYHDYVINRALANNIKIYTVGLGTSSYYFNDYLMPLAENTDGAFYSADDASQLQEIYEDINQKIDIETDWDGDGIPDYYEDHMVSFNGSTLPLNKYSKDSDGDGLKDGEELELKYEYNADKTKVKVTGKLILGNPTLKDTDYDGYIDSNDYNPFIWDISDRDLAIAAGIVYTNLGIGTKIDTSSISLNNGASVKEMVGWTVLDTWHGGAGFYAAALKKDKNIVLAFRGSKPSYEGFIDVDWIDDWVFADIINVVTGISTQVPAAQAFTERIINNYFGYNIYICGHSLGGNLALNASTKALKIKSSVVKRVSTFNGLGMPHVKVLTELFTWDFITLYTNEERFYDYEIEGDIVSGFETKPDKKWYDLFDIELTTGIGHRPSALPQKVKSAHSLENFYLQMGPLGRPIG